MLQALEKEGCLYQEDVVDYLVKAGSDNLLRENADGNVVLATPLLNAFKKITEPEVVWVKPERYWRYRVAEDENTRSVRG
mgnify:CR=1 FL=1